MELKIKLLKNLKIFNNLDDFTLLPIANGLKMVELKMGDILIE